MAKAPKAAHAPDPAWAPLLPAALAGAGRQTFAPLPGLTPPLGTEPDAETKQLLLTAANLTLVQRAGQRSSVGPAIDLGRAAAETYPTLPAETADLLQQMVTNRQLEKLRFHCVKLATGWRLSHRQLGRYLRELPLNRPYLLLARSTLGGVRGEWMLEWHSHDYLRRHRYQRVLTTGWWLPDAEDRQNNLYRPGSQRPPDDWDWLLREWPTAWPDQRQELLELLTTWTEKEPLPRPSALCWKRTTPVRPGGCNQTRCWSGCRAGRWSNSCGNKHSRCSTGLPALRPQPASVARA